MKKKLLALAFFAAAMGATAQSWAFQSLGRSTFTAGVLVGGVETATATIVIRDVVDPYNGINRSSITWSGVTPPSTGWKVANQLFKISSTITAIGGGLQIYTRNTDPDAVPSFVDPTPGVTDNPDSNPAGLLRATGSTTTVALPLAWSIKASSGSIPVAANPNNNGQNGNPSDPNAFQWLFMVDRATPDIPSTNTTAFADGAPYHSIITDAGIHFGQSPAEFGGVQQGQDTFVYMQANFTTATAQTPYQTSTLTIEAFRQ